MAEVDKIQILVVDDEPALRKAIAFDFVRAGYKVFEAESGNKALEIIESSAIDIVLTDVRMPDGDGIHLLNVIRQTKCARPYVMFVTGFADITVEEAYEKGVYAVFEKPFDRKDLMNSVAEAAEEINSKRAGDLS